MTVAIDFLVQDEYSAVEPSSAPDDEVDQPQTVLVIQSSYPNHNTIN